jgi:hypothetical protein
MSGGWRELLKNMLKNEDLYVKAIQLAKTIDTLHNKIHSFEQQIATQEQNLAFLHEKSIDAILYFDFGKQHEIGYNIEECKELVGNRITEIKARIVAAQKKIIAITFDQTTTKLNS